MPDSIPPGPSASAFPPSDGVPGWFGGALAPGRGGPSEGAVGELFGLPAGVLLEAVVEPALRAPVAQATAAARFVGDVVFEVGPGGGPPAGRPGAGGMPDLGQVPQLDPGIVALSLIPVVARVGADRLERDQQAPLPTGPGRQLPGAVSAGRPVFIRGREGEPRPVPGTGAARRIAPVWRPRFL